MQARQVFRRLRATTRALPLTYKPFEKGSSENFTLSKISLVSLTSKLVCSAAINNPTSVERGLPSDYATSQRRGRRRVIDATLVLPCVALLKKGMIYSGF